MSEDFSIAIPHKIYEIPRHSTMKVATKNKKIAEMQSFIYPTSLFSFSFSFPRSAWERLSDAPRHSLLFRFHLVLARGGKTFLCCCSLFLTLSFYSCQKHDSPALTSFNLSAGAETIALRGTWEFHTGDTSAQNFSATKSFWKPQPVPGFWPKNQGSVFGINWYRTQLRLPEALDRTQNWALTLRQILVAAEIYLDGRLLAKHGKIGASQNAEVPGWDDHIYILPAQGLSPGVHELALRISNHNWFFGGILQPPEFGRFDLLLERHETRKSFNGMIAGLFLLSGVYHFILFVFNRAQREYLLMALLSLSLTLSVVLFELPDLFHLNTRHPEARLRIVWIVMMVVVVLMYRFLTIQFEYKNRGLTKIMLGGSTLAVLPALLPLDLFRLSMVAPLRDYWFVVTLFFGIYIIIWAVRHDKPGSRVLAWGVLPLALGAMWSTLRYESIWAFSGFIIFSTTMAIGLSRKVAGIGREVRRARDVFRLFVPEQLLDKIAHKGLDSIKLGSAEEGTATVMFTDIRSFASIAENLAPGETLSFLNDFMQHMSPVIHAHGGFICQFVGDEIMAIFYNADQAPAAVRCAIAMRGALAEHNRSRARRREKPIEIGIGINTGRVILGTIGSDTRMESCVIGDTVNLASRIQSLTKRYSAKILISAATLRELPEAGQFLHREADLVQVRGKSKSVALYEIFEADPEPIKSQKQQSLSSYTEGLIYFRTGDWPQARARFAACLNLCPEDASAQMYRQRCEDFLHTPPPADWNGVTVLQEK